MRYVWLEIDGWGRVGADIAVSNIDAPGGNIARLTVADVSSFANWVGNCVYVFGIGFGIPDGFYTLVGVGVSTIDIFVLGSFPTGSTSATVRPESWYRLCTSRPPGVTGSQAKATWLPVITADGVPNTIGQRLDPRGGVASADGFSVRVVRDTTSFSARLADLLRYQYPVLGSGTTPALLVDEVSQFSSPWTLTASAGTANTVVYFADNEAVSPSAVAGDEWTIGTNRRGLLGTMSNDHPAATLIFDGFPTPIGARCRLCWIDDSGDPQSQRSAQAGIITDVSLPQGLSEIEILASSPVLSPHVQTVGERIPASAQWSSTSDADDASPQITVTQGTVLERWQWCKAGPVAVRLLDTEGSPATLVGYDAATGLPQVRYTVDDALRPQTPAMLEAVPDGVEWLNLNGHQTARGADGVGVPIDQAYWVEVPGAAGRVRLLAGPFEANPTFSTKYPEIEPCHVFVPVGETLQSEYVARRVDSPGIKINPVEIVLQLIASTGTGANAYGFTAYGMQPNYDVLPGPIGLGIPPERVDLESFERVWASIGEARYCNAYITASQTDNLGEWLSKVLRSVQLGLVTDQYQRLRIVDLANVDAQYTDEISLSSTREAPAAIPEIKFRQNTSLSLSGIRAAWPIRHRLGNRRADIKVIGTLSERYGSARIFGDAAPNVLKLDPPFSLGDDATEAQPIIDRWRRYVSSYYRAVPTTEMRADRGRSVGDVVLISGQINTPDADGLISVLNQRARIVDMRLSVEDDSAEYALTVYEGGAEGEPAPSAWAPSLLIDSVTDATTFVVATDHYVADYRPGDYMANDVTGGLQVGDFVNLYTRNLTLRSTDGPEQIASLDPVTGDVTLSAPWQAGAVDVTPGPGDIIMPAPSTQPGAAGWFAYMDDGDPSNSEWR